jgi:hypothetical protein
MTTNKHDRKEGQLVTAVWRNGGFSASYDSFVVGSNAVLRLNFCAKNPPLRQAAKRYRQKTEHVRSLCFIKRLIVSNKRSISVHFSQSIVVPLLGIIKKAL